MADIGSGEDTAEVAVWRCPILRKYKEFSSTYDGSLHLNGTSIPNVTVLPMSAQ